MKSKIMKSSDKTLITILILILLSFFIFFRGINLYERSPEEKVFNNSPEPFNCLDEQRNVDSCTEIYKPVCGSISVECFAAPCSPVKETFSNSCFACSNPRVSEYVIGEC